MNQQAQASSTLPGHAQTVIIGGGMLGVGLAYHLAKEGWTDVVLLEKGELTSGSTWHAAGLIGHFIGSLNMARVHLYGAELYQTLEAETGQATGWHGTGSVRLATNSDEVDWFHQVKGQLDYIGAECHIVSPEQVRELFPLAETDGVILGAWTPQDGHTDPSMTCNAMATAARSHGARLSRHTRVTGITQAAGGEWLVDTDKGVIRCEHLVNAAGSFACQVAAMSGLELPIVNMIHQYLVTEGLDEVRALDKELPVMRDPRASCYYRQERDGLIIGPYEKAEARPWGLEGIDWGFDQELLPPEMERLEPWLELAIQRIPAFGKAGIKRVVNGPITHTPDGNFLLGPAPGLVNYWLAAGSSIGITQGAGAGKYLAQWMMHGQTEINMASFDPRRYGSWANGQYAVDKSIEEYQHMYDLFYPGESRPAGRPVRTTPLYEQFVKADVSLGQVYGWERAQWFPKPGETENLSFRHNNSFEAVAAECQAVRERAGVLDLSSFSKYDISGPGAAAFLDRLCANHLPRRQGGVILTTMLTELGGIECEATITRMADDHFYMLSAATAERHDLDWLQQHLHAEEKVSIANRSDDFGVLVLSGPKSREILQLLTDADLSNSALPWLRGQEMTVAGIDCRVLRVSYVGELGYELHHPMDRMLDLYNALMQAGEAHGIANYGTYAVNSMRMEKAYRAWGTELTTEITPLEAGIGGFVDFSKDFTGRAAVEQRRKDGLQLQLLYLSVEAGDNDAVGNEPVYSGNEIVGITTSGGYGHTTGMSLAFAYVEPAYANEKAELEIALLGDRRKVKILCEAVYDPGNERLICRE